MMHVENKRGTYSTNSQIKFKAKILKSCLFNYSDVYMFTLFGKRADAVEIAPDRGDKKVIFKNCSRVPTVPLK